MPRSAPFRSALSWTLFPALLSLVVLGATTLLSRDVPLPLVSGGTLLASIVALMTLERIFPLHARWNARPEALDLGLLVLNRGLDVGVLAGTVALLAAAERNGLPLSVLRLWPTDAPLVAQAGLGVLLAEAVRYLLHRLSHRPGLLWRVHRTHHQPERMYALNGPRLHPGNYVWIAIANSVPMLSLGAPGKAVVLAAVVTSFFVLFQHANVQLPFGGWNWLLATPDVHRLHHERRRGRQGVNYGIVLLLFDRLFGTYARHEAEVAVDAIGLDQDALDPTVARPAFGRANALLRTSR